MTDEMFIKKSKESIVEHFNSHCKVGDMFEDCEKITPESVELKWLFDGSGMATDTRGIFQIVTPTPSLKVGIFYHAAVTLDEQYNTVLVFDILKVLDHVYHKKIERQDLTSNAIYVIPDIKPDQKRCEAEVLFFKGIVTDD